jgi:glyoxylase-like metal-dependent hydrolase (beta-lactamase superfamily II)
MMNQYVVGCFETREAAIIDAGGDPSIFLDFCEREGLRVTKILQTHGHVDHVAMLAETREATGAPVYFHPLAEPVAARAPSRGVMYGFEVTQPPEADYHLANGGTVDVGSLRFSVWHTPGHAPGHVCFVSVENNVVFGGDLLFKGSVGRTDLPGCDPSKMGPSLSRLFTLADDTIVYAGHMEPTTIGYERVTNPFLDAFDVVR